VLSLISNIANSTKGAQPAVFNFIHNVFPRVSPLSPFPRSRHPIFSFPVSRPLAPSSPFHVISLVFSSKFFPVRYVSLDFSLLPFLPFPFPSPPPSRRLVPFPYFILASSREKLCTSPPHFSCPLCWCSYVLILHCSVTGDEDLLAAFRSFHGRDTSRVANLVRKLCCCRLVECLLTFVTCKQERLMIKFLYSK